MRQPGDVSVRADPVSIAASSASYHPLDIALFSAGSSMSSQSLLHQRVTVHTIGRWMQDFCRLPVTIASSSASYRPREVGGLRMIFDITSQSLLHQRVTVHSSATSRMGTLREVTIASSSASYRPRFCGCLSCSPSAIVTIASSSASYRPQGDALLHLPSCSVSQSLLHQRVTVHDEGSYYPTLFVNESQSLLHQRVTAHGKFRGGKMLKRFMSQSLLHQRVTAHSV